MSRPVIGTEPVVRGTSVAPLTRRSLYEATKRMIDFIVAAAGLLLLCPVLGVIAVAIKTDSRGSVFYRGLRVGRGGKPFRMLKFRSMVIEADRLGAASTPDDDPRLTRVGRRLRRYKLDEMPQLFNVLIGDMSLVGPRPQVPWAVDKYTPEERAILTVRPGMTDFASVAFMDEGTILRGSSDPDRDYFEKIHPYKMRLGLKYVKEMSLSTDLSIIAATLANLAGKRHADGEAAKR